jgi:hypothetical protein
MAAHNVLLVEVEPRPSPRQSNRHHTKFERPIGPTIVRSRGRLSFHANPPQKPAIAATIAGVVYRGMRVSRSASEPRQSRQRLDTTTSFSSISGARHREPPDGVDSDPRGRDGDSMARQATPVPDEGRRRSRGRSGCMPRPRRLQRERWRMACSAGRAGTRPRRSG